MTLHSEPFQLIASGSKTIELRLWDEKRRLLNKGDVIIFNHELTNEVIYTKVKILHCFSSFKELYQTLPLGKCGYSAVEIHQARPDDMLAYYTKSQEKRYGVVGIEIELIVK